MAARVEARAAEAMEAEVTEEDTAGEVTVVAVKVVERAEAKEEAKGEVTAVVKAVVVTEHCKPRMQKRRWRRWRQVCPATLRLCSRSCH